MPSRDAQLAEALERLAVDPGDQGGWDKLYRVTWPFVRSVTHRFLRGATDLAEDVSQEVYLRVARYCTFQHMREPDDFRRYLFTIAMNVSRSFLRKHLGIDESLRDYATMLEAAKLQKYSEGWEQPELEELLDLILGSLDEQNRKIIHLLLSAHSISEISTETGLSYANTAVRIHRLRRKLLDYLNQHNPPAKSA